MSNQHQEFPELTQQAQAANRAGRLAALFPETPLTKEDRRYLSAFLRESLNQACEAKKAGKCCRWEALQFIAENFHSPPPPPPTLAQARAADLDTPAGKDVVRHFLASVREVDQ